MDIKSRKQLNIKPNHSRNKAPETSNVARKWSRDWTALVLMEDDGKVDDDDDDGCKGNKLKKIWHAWNTFVWISCDKSE